MNPQQAEPDYYRDELYNYINEQAKLSDQSSHEWEKEGGEQQAAYRSGMWYAYNDIRNKLGSISTKPGTPLLDKLKELEDALNRANALYGAQADANDKLVGELNDKLSQLSAIVVEAEKLIDVTDRLYCKEHTIAKSALISEFLSVSKQTEALITAYNTQKEGDGDTRQIDWKKEGSKLLPEGIQQEILDALKPKQQARLLRNKK